jgi:hypothetical protein
MPLTIATYEHQLADLCRQLHGMPGVPKDTFVAHGDLNGDGIEDWAFDEGGFNCEGAASIFTGSGGSQVVVFIGLTNGDARIAFQHGAYGMRLERIGSRSILWLGVGGALCGQAGEPSHAEAIYCDRLLVWNMETKRFDFAPLVSIRTPRHINND